MAGNKDRVFLGGDIPGDSSDDPLPSAKSVPELPVLSGPSRPAGRVLSNDDRGTLERWARSRSASFRLVLRTRIVLMTQSGVSRAATADALGTTTRTVRLWCRRFEAGGIEAIRHDAPGRGRRAGLQPETVEAIVRLTRYPADRRRPTAREVARAVGTSAASVCRVWAAQGLRPARARRHAADGALHRSTSPDAGVARCETGSAEGPTGVPHRSCGGRDIQPHSS